MNDIQIQLTVDGYNYVDLATAMEDSLGRFIGDTDNVATLVQIGTATQINGATPTRYSMSYIWSVGPAPVPEPEPVPPVEEPTDPEPTDPEPTEPTDPEPVA